ncbi:hypothetical protein F4779DRAFT_531466 [Xylariaceae sp. FL0662B]|nr:hypothetical protein F4779DRAFT_531466 [Xylariaceae sp. FL0662B]
MTPSPPVHPRQGVYWPMTNPPDTTANAAANAVPKVKSMDYHRQVLQSKMEEEKYGDAAALLPQKHPTDLSASPGRNKQQYTSPSDNIMSPCTAKLNALKGRLANKVKPKSLFAQKSAKKSDGENVLGAENTERPPSSENTKAEK